MIDNYKDLTIRKFNELNELRFVDGDDDDLYIKMVAILDDKTEDEVLNMPLDEFASKRHKLNFLAKKPSTISILPKKLTINNKRYRLEKDAFHLNAGQYIDYKMYIKDTDAFYDNLSKILTVFIIPEDAKYGDGYDTAELAEELEDSISIELAISISNFFFRLFQGYISRILRSLESTMRKATRRNRTTEAQEAMAAMALLRRSVNDGFGSIGL